MPKPLTTIPLADIILDEGIYPRQKIDPKRVNLFAENIRDNFPFDPIEVEPHPEKPANTASWTAPTVGAPIRPQE